MNKVEKDAEITIWSWQAQLISHLEKMPLCKPGDHWSPENKMWTKTRKEKSNHFSQFQRTAILSNSILLYVRARWIDNEVNTLPQELWEQLHDILNEGKVREGKELEDLTRASFAEERETLAKSIKDMKREGKILEDLAISSFTEERKTLTKSLNDIKEDIMALKDKLENVKKQESDIEHHVLAEVTQNSHIEQIIKALMEDTKNDITNILNEHTRKIAMLLETANDDQAELMKCLLKAQRDDKGSSQYLIEETDSSKI